ncbi:MAG: DmsC/YnfH family molybdoenzyme membrane anchor subunit [Hyphomicrobiaceae bacterium]
MHPAYSVILFTTASGAGYGLLVWLAVSALLVRIIPPGMTPALVAFGTAFALITVGLMSSTLHLGRPERAWRAMSQWRTSWLSREGVLAIITYPIAGLLALAWMYGFGGPILTGLLALATIASAVATLWCTGMIYASLPTVRAWHMPLVAPIYVVLGLATGGVLHNLIGTLLLGTMPVLPTAAALVALAVAWFLKSNYWESIDSAARTYTAESATGLGGYGKVRSLDPPHSRANFVMREMGYEVARKHALKLRRLVMLALFAIPAGCLVLSLLTGAGMPVLLALIAAASAAVGVATERWLFFAEAEHVVVLFYGKDAA